MELRHLISLDDYKRLEGLYNDIRSQNAQLRIDTEHLHDVLDGWRDVHTTLEKEYHNLQQGYQTLEKKCEGSSAASEILASQLEEMMGIISTQQHKLHIYETTLRKQSELTTQQKEKIKQYEDQLKNPPPRKTGKSYHPQVRFEEIGGLQHLITELEKFSNHASNPEQFQELGLNPHYSLLMHGPPGCGKTMIGEAIASELQYAFIKINIPEIVSKWLGETEQNLQKVFTECRQIYQQDKQRVVLFLDEADSLLKHRGQDSTQVMDRTLNIWLQETEVLSKEYGTLLVAATNRLEDLDPAAIRRFKKVINIPLPSKEALCDILEKQITGIEYKRHEHSLSTHKNLHTLFDHIDIVQIAQAMVKENCSGSDVNRILEQCREDLLEQGTIHIITTRDLLNTINHYFEERSPTKKRKIGLI